MQKITPCLWFETQAEEAATFYTSLFNNSEITNVTRYPGPEGQYSVVAVSFHLDGQEFIALNGSPQIKFTDAISLYVDCKDQDEVDYLWLRLIADGGEETQSGWLKDKFGVSWQIIPSILRDLLRDPDPEKSGRVTQAMLRMQKMNIQELKDAYHNA